MNECVNYTVYARHCEMKISFLDIDYRLPDVRDFHLRIL